MTQSSEERLPEAPLSQPTARIIPFDRQSELQRAVQQRAQEHLDAEAIKPKVPLVRRVVIFAVALIPVAIIVAGFMATVHAVRVITSLYAPAPAPPPPPAEVPAESQRGVVILMPDKTVTPPPAETPATVPAESN
jgi:hypothetical protein